MTLRGNAKLFVGEGESGKSTVLKQMRIILSKYDIPKWEGEKWRGVLFKNMVLALKIALEDMHESGLGNIDTSIVSSTSREWSEVIGMLSLDSNN